MTDDAVRRALRAVVQEAFRACRQHSGPVALERTIEYAEGIVLPIVEARVEQALEDGFQSAPDRAEHAP